jgi:peptide/nickel transport system permease protein
MIRYIIRRLLWLVVVVLVITLFTYFIFFKMSPIDPAIAFAGKSPTPQQIEEIRRQFGLDKPFYAQYGIFVKHVVTGDQYGWPGLGFSYQSNSPIKDELFKRTGVTMQLAVGAAVMWLLIGIPIGLISALKRRSLVDRAAMTFALFGVSTPVFWLGLMALYFLWFRWHIFPGTGYVPFGESPWQWATHMFLPWLVLSLLFAAFYARMVRGNMIEVMNEDYIRTARAKGISERQVIVKHGMRASLAPVVTMLGLDFGSLIGGAIVTESVFNLKGLGAWVVDSVYGGDLPVVVAVTVVSAITITSLSLIVDVVYAFIDPRVRYT